MKDAIEQLEELGRFFETREELDLVLLIGSRVAGRARDGSDWDFAVQWRKGMSFEQVLENSPVLSAKDSLGTRLPDAEVFA